ncbi:hypothetical protein BDZ94DRAFT_1326895 [Collybia nuda]|uniref:Uncharacterized protein n=1 Tax=Collybia nuda TaxID=64659 RepID=A0A9P5XU00_9AGAR|nr:hypothetical protein BDZ94DRAFT_1326895 [Collybia nuda]
MGSLCSKSGTHSGGHTLLGPSSNVNPGDPSPSDPRAAAAEAAERRMKAAQARGTSASNPNQGKLAAQAAKQSKVVPEPRQEERLVVSVLGLA